MRFDVMTLFPDMIKSITNTSIIGRACEGGIIDVNVHNIRDFSLDKHRKVDDTPYGGGMGMLMTIQPIMDCYKSFADALPQNKRVIYMSPKGKVLTHRKAKELSCYDSLVFLCGHYEGVDERVLDMIIDEEISVGDYVLTGGELPCAIVIDAVSRLIPGVLSDSVCYEDESIASGLLEYPQYTKPYEYEGRKVPDVLLSGDHKKIEAWRRNQALLSTLKHRPELLKKTALSKKDILFLEKINNTH